jgi:hypothetical protein
MITITIDAHPDRGSLRGQIDESMEALGFHRENASPPAEMPQVRQYETGAEIAEADPAEPATTIARERGKPAPGHARRTKAEIAEDEAADKADAAVRAAGEETGAIVADKHVDRGNISTGEERIDPENSDDDSADDDEETAAQDAADEAAETAAATGGKATLDDVRNALGKYVARFGMAAAQEDGPKVITMVCGDGHVKMSDIPDDPAIVAKVRDGVLEMLEKNPFQRKAAA